MIDTSFDRSKMLEYYRAWPDQALAYRSSLSLPEIKKYESVTITGWGASLIPSMFIYSTIEPHVPEGLFIMRGIEPPKPRGKALFLAVSMGGDTLEVSYSLKRALEMGYEALALAGGGLLERASKKWGVPLVKLPKAPASRLGFPIIALTVAKVLDETLGIDSFRPLADAFERLKGEVNNAYEEAESLALWFKDAQNVVVYHSPHQETLSMRMKYLMSENAKLRSFHEDILEVIHDGIGCWEYEYGSKLLLLRDPLDHQIISERFDIVKEVVESLRFKTREMPIYEGTRPFFLLRRMYTLDLSTVYLGLLRRSDPSVVRTQAEARRKMKAMDFFRKIEEEVSS